MIDFETPPARTLPEYRAAAIRRELEAAVSGGNRHRQIPRHRKPLLIATVAVAVAAGASAGGYAYAQRSAPVTDKTGARCYTVASLSAGPQSLTEIARGTPVGSSRPAQVDDALSVCAALWRQGFLRAGPQGASGPVTPDPDGTKPVPPLAACVMGDGTAAVFPGTKSTCAALGLPNAAG